MVLHVSAPYSRTSFAVVLKILILMLMVRLVITGRRVALALLILTFTLFVNLA